MRAAGRRTHRVQVVPKAAPAPQGVPGPLELCARTQHTCWRPGSARSAQLAHHDDSRRAQLLRVRTEPKPRRHAKPGGQL